MRMQRWPSLLLLGALVIFLSIGAFNLRAPGVQYDEAADAVPALELLHGQPTSALSHITIAGREWPLMMLHYIGPTSIYTSAVGFVIFGQTVEALRLMQLVLGALTLVLLYVLGRVWFDPPVAAVATLLCATSPVFLWWSRAGIHFALPLLPLALGMLIALTHWKRSHRARWFVLAGLLFGLGLTTKLLFAWLVVPLGLSAVMTIGLGGLWRLVKAVPAHVAALGALATLIGLTPFIIHNTPSLDSFRYVLGNTSQSQLYGHNNLDFVNNVAFEAKEFWRMTGGDTIHFDAPAGWPLGAVSVVLALAATLITLARRPHDGKRWFLVLAIITVVPLATFSVTATGARHLFIILPLVWLLVACALFDWIRAVATNAARIVSVILLGLLSANHIWTNVRVADFFLVSGGQGLWSSTIYRIANALQGQYAGRPLILLDWGFERNLALVTDLAVRGQEVYEFTSAPSRAFDDLASVLVRDTGKLYLAHEREQTVFAGHVEALLRAAEKQHKRLVQVASFPDISYSEPYARPNAVFYDVIPISASFDVSPALATRNAALSSGLMLLGGNATYDSAHRQLTVRLQWQSQADKLPDDTVLMHVVNQATGQVVLNADTQPVYGSYPFPRWQKGEVVIDPRWVTLPTDLPTGVYQVRVGAYDPATGVRRTILDPHNDAAGNSLMLATFQVP